MSITAGNDEKLRLMYRITGLIHSATSRRNLLARLLREVVAGMDADGAMLGLATDEGETLVFEQATGNLAAYEDAREQVEQMLTTSFTSRRQVRVECGLVAGMVEGGAHVGTVMCVPLHAGREEIGALCVGYEPAREPPANAERLLTQIAAEAAKLLRTARIYQRLEQQSRNLEALFDTGQALISPAPLPDLLNRITRTLMQLMRIQQCSVMLLNERGELVLSAMAGGSQAYMQRPVAAFDPAAMGNIIAEPGPLTVVQVRKAEGDAAAPEKDPKEPTSLLAVPILFNANPVGMLTIYTGSPRVIRDDERRLLDAFASLCAVAIENARRYEKVMAAEQSLRQTDRLATLGTLAAEIAHEVRNPVTTITMLLHSLLEEHSIAPERERDITIILEKLEHINRIVSQVLNFSSKRDVRLERLDVNAVLRDVAFLVEHHLAARHVGIKEQLAADLPPIMIDRSHLEQVFLNLILNAAEAMPNGGILTVRTASEEVDAIKGVTITLRDTGIGIPPEVLPQLFQPFVSTRAEGIGLGLFVSQKLLAQYGASIDVKSALNKGSTFTVRIPIEDVIE